MSVTAVSSQLDLYLPLVTCALEAEFFWSQPPDQETKKIIFCYVYLISETAFFCKVKGQATKYIHKRWQPI